MAVIDSLEVQLQGDAKGAGDAIDGLNKKLDGLIDRIGSLGSLPGLSAMAEKIRQFTAGVSAATKSAEPQMQKISRTAEEINKRFEHLGRGFRLSGTADYIQKQLDSYKNALASAKLKEEELSAKGKIDTKAYEDAAANVQKFTNIVESLTSQLQEMQSTAQSLDGINIHLMSDDNRQTLEELQSSLERFRAALQSKEDYQPLAEVQQGLEELRERFPEAEQWAKEFENSIAQIGGMKPVENLWDGAAIPPELKADMESAKSSVQSVSEAASKTADGSSFGKLQGQIALVERRAEALREKLAQVWDRLKFAGGSGAFGAALSKLSPAAERVGTALSSLEPIARKASSAMSGAASRVSGAAKIMRGAMGEFGKFSKEVFSEFSATTGKVAKTLSKLASAAKKIGSAVAGTASKMGGATKPMLGLKKAGDKTGISFAGGFKTFLKYAFGLEGIRAALNRLQSGLRDGMKSLAGYSSETNAAMSSMQSSLDALKNSLAVAFAPIVNVVAPYISAFLDMMTNAANAVGRLFAALTGQSFAAQAKKGLADFSSGISKAGGSAKKAGKDAQQGFRSFDELKTISISRDEGGGGADDSSSDMFTTVQVEEPMKNFADKVKEAFSGIFDVFEKAWSGKGMSVIDSARSALEGLGTSALSVGKTFYDVFTNGTGLAWLEGGLELLRSMLDVISSIATAFANAWNGGSGAENVTALFGVLTNANNLLASMGDSFSRVFSGGVGIAIWENILGIVTGIYDTIGNLAQSIQAAWDTAGLGDSIWRGVLGVANAFYEALHNVADATAEWAARLDFTPLLSSVDTLLTAMEPLAANIGAGLEWLWNNVLLPIAGWTMEEALPTFLDMLSAAIEALNAVASAFQLVGEWLWNEFLLPLGQWTGGVAISAMESMTGLLHTLTGALTENQGAAGVLSEAFDRISEILTPLAEFLGTLFVDAWDGMITPALQFLGDTVLPAVTGTFENLWNNVLVPLGSFIGDVLEPVIQIVSDALTILWKNVVVPLAGAIGGVLAKAFKGICEVFNKTVIPIAGSVIKVFQFLWNNVFSPIVNFLRSTFKPIFENVFKAIGGIIDNLGRTFGGLIDFVTGVFSANWGKAWDGIVDMFKGTFNLIPTIMEGVINSAIGLVNGIIGGINSLTGVVGIPEIPEIPEVALPHFEKGGITLRHTLAEIGEYNRPEAILPLTNDRAMGMIAERIYENYNGGVAESGFSADVIERAVYTATYNAVSAAIQNNRSSGGDVNLQVDLDGDVVYKKIIKKTREEKGRIFGGRLVLAEELY